MWLVLSIVLVVNLGSVVSWLVSVWLLMLVSVNSCVKLLIMK